MIDWHLLLVNKIKMVSLIAISLRYFLMLTSQISLSVGMGFQVNIKSIPASFQLGSEKFSYLYSIILPVYDICLENKISGSHADYSHPETE